VIAVGSNRAPEQLARKFAGLGDVAIPVIRCRVWDFDAVYSAHFARYGAIPAALRQAPGTISELALTWLDAAELTRMHETEALGFNYDYGIAKGLRLEPELGPVPDRVYAYIGHRGYLDHAGAPVALAEVAAEGRTVPALAQEEMQRRVHAGMGQGTTFEAFVLGNADDEPLRRGRIGELAETAHPPAHGPFKIL